MVQVASQIRENKRELTMFIQQFYCTSAYFYGIIYCGYNFIKPKIDIVFDNNII